MNDILIWRFRILSTPIYKTKLKTFEWKRSAQVKKIRTEFVQRKSNTSYQINRTMSETLDRHFDERKK